jgi:DNA-binding response OmpR family regulator
MINNTVEGPIVLVVEDVEETRDGIEALLKVDGYRVDPARDEGDAVRRARSQPPDLVLVSLGGSAVNVVATALRIRQRAELGLNVPVVIFSIQTVDEGAEVEIEQNVYVTRPDNFHQLRDFLCRLLRYVPATF